MSASDGPTPSSQPEEEEVKVKVDTKAEVHKLFKQLKSGQSSVPVSGLVTFQPPPMAPKKKSEKGTSRRKPFFQITPSGRSGTTEIPGEEILARTCADLVVELNVADKLIQFCQDLPVLQKLSDKGENLSHLVEGSGEGNEDMECRITPLIKR